jgi:hypothetical protein
MGTTEYSAEHVELAINKAIDKALPKFVEACKKDDRQIQSDCCAFQIFPDKEEKRKYFEFRRDFRIHQDFHIRHEKMFKVLIGLPWIGFFGMLIVLAKLLMSLSK